MLIFRESNDNGDVVKKLISQLTVASFIFLSTACSNGGNKANDPVPAPAPDPCRDDATTLIGVVNENEKEENETLRGIRPHTKRKVVLMPVTFVKGSSAGGYTAMVANMQRGGGGTAGLAPFATEIMNMAFLNEGINTLAWFKVEKELKKVIPPFSQQEMMAHQHMQLNFGVEPPSIVNDSNINELIDTARNLGACYVVRPVILQATNTNKVNVNPLFGFTSLNKNAEVEIKVSIISTRQELDNPIIAIKTFAGRSSLVNKDRASALDELTGGSILGNKSSDNNQSRVAFYDTIDKIVEFLSDKMI